MLQGLLKHLGLLPDQATEAPRATRRPLDPFAAARPSFVRMPLGPEDMVLSPFAVQWLKALPAAWRPQALANRYPRLVNRLALCWKDPELTFRVLDDLLVDKRGGRQGFPPAVAADLARLYELHQHRVGNAATQSHDPWSRQSMAVSDR